ncbi:MAG: winged helix-turn-helix transcriptional regulator [Candidatus Thorarchaeota archaeon]|nr:winged helix-turn-helix transcriptional regulator [Candidatus Thorarchaeota archaeon]
MNILSPRIKGKAIKEFVVISNLKTIKLLLDRTRADIVFKYLVNQEMTVKQLADAMGKKPGTVLHHVQKLNSAGIIQLVRTHETTRGIVERYYRAIAREYRLGISEMMRSRARANIPKDPIPPTLAGLSTIGIVISAVDMEHARGLLTRLKKIEEEIEKLINDPDNYGFQSLPPSIRTNVLKNMHRFLLSKNSEYRQIIDEWHDLLSQYLDDTEV